ncbi:MAG TPA: oxidoreductase, partial [Candidatus Latescibacteria bacterium]|nr:oxidoreductase [Candidatus Latescibacterota bacterium]
MTKDLIRVGVVGVGRGQSFVEGATEAAGMKLVALCDIWEARLHDLAGQHHVAA